MAIRSHSNFLTSGALTFSLLILITGCGKVAGSIAKNAGKGVDTIVDVATPIYVVIPMNAKLVPNGADQASSDHQAIYVLDSSEKKSLREKDSVSKLKFKEDLSPTKTYELWVYSKSARLTRATTYESQLQLVVAKSDLGQASLQIVPQVEGAEDPSIIKGLQTQLDWKIVEVSASAKESTETLELLSH
ncbi:MAG: hypothetical protein EOP09_05550 [Proteobacteria bacterium]|nr:MAG: hypothetical protein EOP09_05550 [Pseudomonadota bacterium]